MDQGPGLLDARLQPVVKLYRIGMYCLIYLVYRSAVFTSLGPGQTFSSLSGHGLKRLGTTALTLHCLSLPS